MIIQIFILVYGLIICRFLTVDFILYQNKSSDFGLLENNWLRRQRPILNVVKSSKTVSEEEKCVLWNQPKLELKEKCCNLKKNIEDITQISERHAAQRNASLCLNNSTHVGSDVDQPTNSYSVNNSTKTNELSCSVYSFLQLPFLFDFYAISLLNCFIKFCHCTFLYFIKILQFLLVFVLDLAGKIVSIKETRFSCDVSVRKIIIQLSLLNTWLHLKSYYGVKVLSTKCFTSVNKSLPQIHTAKFNKNSEGYKHIFSSSFWTSYLFDWLLYPVFSLSRLASFRPLTTLESPVSFLSLSEAGFSYSGDNSFIVCEGCGKKNDFRQIAGDPNSCVYHNPGCTFVRQDEVDNGHIQTDSSPSSIPLLNTNNSSEHLAANHVQEISSLDTQLSRLSTSVSLGEPNPGPPSSLSTAINSTVRGASNIPQQTGSLLLGHPCYPIYIALQKRYESFNKWPIPHIQSPRDLAVAGFFYAGYDDCVRCYYCGLGLKSWKLGDDVYTEHEKLRPSCEFLQSQRYISSTGPARDVRPRTSSHQNEAPHASGRVPPSVRQPIGARTSSILQVDSVLTDQSTPDGATGGRNVPDLECDGVRPGMTAVQTEETDSGANATARAVDKNTTKSLLKKENKYLHQLLTCKVCEQAPIKDLFLPCGDLYACTDCAQKLSHCPLCNKKIMGTVMVYFS
uniref:RING-type domain-containing protein n=1 Tax=Biomphalaria glabrata TaxID=6526 RepID=A0A2C9M4V5_BIOGL